ncbi:hypothetical protein HPP92_008601 [Vanilla planifolia]|uniref:Lysine-specific demethylase JMJ16 n=1 Tax=Vanilla planifolia TaxID=51239 RepID=A0A835V3X6_VANPL|nr:hypothetical protein HPP92_008601 [Vanilla planifolia]
MRDKMFTECIMASVKDETDGIPSVPPGFVSFKSFTLQRVQDCSLVTTFGNESEKIKMDCEDGTTDVMKLRKSLRHRPWVNYCQHDTSSGDEELDSELADQDALSVHSVPKRVIHGCAERENCQKVIAKWRPEGSCRPILEEAPVFYPTEEEFKDTLKYIANIHPKVEPYGICRIVPPPSWKPTCPLKEKHVWEGSTFTTRIQRIDKLQNRDSLKNESKNNSIMRKRRKLLKLRTSSRENDINISEISDAGSYSQRFGSNIFRNGTNSNVSENLEPSLENIEGEYWRIVEHPTEEIEVLYGADLETGVFGSGFSKASSCSPDSDSVECYVKSGWNLNNVPRLPGSVLAFESGEISGVLVPWLYIGMCFSSFCWHVEDHHLYSVNYLHWGAPKIWYGVPGREALNLETAMKKHLTDLFEEQPNLLHKLVTQFSPSILKLESVPVYRCIQRPGEFVLTFPRAYHAGFNCGFNCAEAVNVAPVDWLPHGQNAVELYREQMRRTTISHDKLLLGAARETVRALWSILFLKKDTFENCVWKATSGPGGVLAKSLKARVELEKVRRQYLSSCQFRKMDSAFDADFERECFICHYDLHLSAAACPCSPDKFTCLVHAKHLCSCDWKTRFFLFRYEITELNILIDAVGGKLSAVHKWGVQDLKLSLSSYVNKDKPSDSKSSDQACSDTKKGSDEVGSSQDYSVSSKNTISMQGGKASVLQSSVVSKARAKAFAVESTTAITNPDMPCQKRKTAFLPIAKDPDGQDNSLLKIKQHQNLQEMNGSDGRISEESTKDTTRAQSSASTEYHASCSSSKPEIKLQSELVSGVSTLDTNIMTSKDGLPFNISDKRDQIMPQNLRKRKLSAGEDACNAMITNDREKICNSQKKQIPVPPRTCTTVVDQQRVEEQDDLQHADFHCQSPLEPREQGKGEACPNHFSDIPNQSIIVPSGQRSSSHNNLVNVSIERHSLNFLATKEVSECGSKSSDNDHTQQCHKISISNDDKNAGQVDDSDSSDNKSDSGKSVATSSSSLSTGVRQNHMQKGPRIKKALQRIDCNVELLECGYVLSGSLWCTSQTIFPKGYRSRVRYWSIIDPSQTCFYVSEILDAGLLRPLFMVKLEQNSSEVFFHICATKCWDMVRERVNYEIKRMHNLGRVNLPSLQPPGSIDGLEMFGLTSQTIIQAIKAINQNPVRSDYWQMRTQIPNQSDSGDQRPALNNEVNRGLFNSLLAGTNSPLRGLFKRANSEELHALCTILSINEPGMKHALLELIKEENRSRLGFQI